MGIAISQSRALALGFAASHVVVSAFGAVAPAAYGRPWLGAGADEPAARAAIRGFALCDGLMAGLVVDGVLRGTPLASRLRFGAASDVSRALTALTAAPAAPRAGTAAVVAASLTGATLATVLSFRDARG